MIHGSDVANVFFESVTTSFAGGRDAAAIIEKERSKLEREASGEHQAAADADAGT
jgi:hypothetical protein